MKILQVKEQFFVNRDPQKRCYNGAYFDAGYEWGQWQDFCTESAVTCTLEHWMKYWRELNDYAVSQRGEGARKQFRIVERLC